MSEPDVYVKRPTTIVVEIHWVDVDDGDGRHVAVDEELAREDFERALKEIVEEWGAV